MMSSATVVGTEDGPMVSPRAEKASSSKMDVLKSFVAPPPFLHKLDMFAEPMPSFNLEGKQKVRTYPGGLLSLFIFYLTFMFSVIKLSHLLSRHNPIVNTYLERDVFDETFEFDIQREDLMVAFTLEDYNTLVTKSDTRYVKFFVQYSNMTNGDRQMHEIGLHPCTEEDYAKFYPVETRSSSLLDRYLTRDDSTLYCLDEEDFDYLLFGTQEVKTFGSLQFMAVPCNMRLTHIGAKTDDRIDPNCVDDLQKQIEYLGSLNFVVYYNRQQFVVNEFGEGRIEKLSTI